MRRGLRRVAAPPRAMTPASLHTFEAPVGGWVTNTALARPVANAARMLRNWYPSETGIVPRGGSSTLADLGTDPVKSLFSYRSGATRRFYAAIAGSIWDISGTPSEDITGQTSDEYSTTQFDTGSGGNNYLVGVNGVDNPILNDGTSWQAGGITNASTPISITGVDPKKFSYVFTYRNRLYFIERNSLTVWYLAIDSIGGAAQDFTLSGIVRKGGKLLTGGSWSIDSGAGPDDKFWLLTDQGELVAFQGADPGASDWGYIGVYDIGKPMGALAQMRAGGDVLIATNDGLVPFSQALTKDSAALKLSSVSRNIAPDWVREARSRTSMPWSVVKWPEGGKAYVGLPVVDDGVEPLCYVVNLNTGAWCEYYGWDVRCFGEHNGNVYFGTSDGKVMRAEDTGKDGSSSYIAKCILQFDHMRRRGQYKEMKLMRTVIRGSRPLIVQPSCTVDYRERLPTAPNSAPDSSEDTWDNGLWDEAVWDASGNATAYSRWQSVVGAGFVHAAVLQATIGAELAPDAEVIEIGAMFQPGNVVV